MRKETIYLIVAFVLTIIILGVVYFYFTKKPAISPQKPSFIFPKITTTTPLKIATPTETTLPSPPGTTTLGKIKKFEAKKFQSGNFTSEYLLVYKEGLEPKTKLYMPYDGNILYYNQDQQNLNFQITTADGKKTITIIGFLKPLCQVTKTEAYAGSPTTNYYCENVKKGKIIAEISEDIKKTSRDIAFQIYNYVNNKEDLNFLYQTLPLIFK
jgi:hypothetical protein